MTPATRGSRQVLARREQTSRAGPFVPGIGVENCRLIWTSGMLARDAQGVIVGRGDISAQTRQCLLNIADVLAAGGASLQDVIKLTVYLKNADPAEYAAMNAVRCELMQGAAFASTAVQAGFFADGALVEIEAVAAVPLSG